MSDPLPGAQGPGSVYHGPTGTQSGTGNTQNNTYLMNRRLWQRAANPKKRVAMLGAVGFFLLVIVIVFVEWSHFFPRSLSVSPRIYWSKPLNIGETGTLFFPDHGYPKAKITFSLDDAEPNGALCAPDTLIGLSVGPQQNNLQPLGRSFGPGGTAQATVNLPSGSEGTWIAVTIENTNKQQTRCPVNLHVTAVTLMKG
ncbi:hypothetical protein OG204_23130 [Streptomyces sp. NBC_01387]|uniref:hypothetical protein n=1 Tax=Streptomyces sp. NBC_01387 TaxID=2903849 RepID=UPI0032452047